MAPKSSYEELDNILHYSHSMLENINSCVITYEVTENGLDFIISDINKAVEEVEHVKKDTIVGRRVSEVFPSIKEFGLFDVLLRVWKSGKSEHHPTAFYQDGRISGWRDNHVSKLFSGKIISVYVDKTKRQENDKPRKESEVFFQTIFDTIQDGITVLDTELNIIKMNQAMERWYSPQRPYLGTKCYHTYHNRSSTCEGCPAMGAIEGGTLQTKIVPRGGPAGTPGWIELSAFPIVNNEGNTIGAVEYVRNITARKTAEEESKNSEQQLKEIINFLPDPTWVINKEGEIIQWNCALERLTNKMSSEMLGKGNYEYAIPFVGKRKPVLIDFAIDPNKDWEDDYKYLDKEGQVLTNPDGFYPLLGKNGLYLSATASPLYDSCGVVVGAIETVRDITEQKLLELEKEKFTKIELNQALSNVKLLSGLLPICASCKKIRDDSGYWNLLETYIQSHSEAKFTHGLCPECVKDLYGNDEWFINKRKGE